MGAHETKVWSTPVQGPLPLLAQRRVVGRKDSDPKQPVSSCFFPSHFNSRRSTAGGSPTNSSSRLGSSCGHSRLRGGSGSEDDGHWLVSAWLLTHHHSRSDLIRALTHGHFSCLLYILFTTRRPRMLAGGLKGPRPCLLPVAILLWKG